MPTSSQKKAPSRRGSTVRDISVRKIQPEDESFQVHRIDEEAPQDVTVVRPLTREQSLHSEVNTIEAEVEQALASMNPQQEQSMEDAEPRDFVRVKFSKFVQLVSSRDCSEVVNANMDEDVVLSSNLLTELAGSHDGREEKKIPLVFLVGLAIGVVLTYILIMK